MTPDRPALSDHKQVILGTAGHIDHGKTRLVQALTGVNTDRLPEEQARGISIDLGFAHFRTEEFEFAVVDVPGHERFIRNMVAGATGIDMALLVVAADDGVMPQTVEHLEIMHLLGIDTGLVVISKADLVDPELIELARLDIASRMAGTFLEHAPVIAVSSTTGTGLAELTRGLVSLARGRTPRPSSTLFRMPIDRVFSVAGHGTVVTGSILSGEVRPGDVLELLPAGTAARVRGVQRNGRPVDRGGPGCRCAINLAGIRVQEVARGDELATPGSLSPTSRLLVRTECLTSSPVSLTNRAIYRLHLGTAEVSARIIIKENSIAPGARGYAELRLERPVVATWGQPFLLRRPSPAATIAGGVILDPGLPTRQRIPGLAQVAAPRELVDPIDRLAAYFAERDEIPDSPNSAAWSVGIPPEQYPELVRRLFQRGEIVECLPGGKWVHRQRLEKLAKAMLSRIHAEVTRRQPRRSLPRGTLMNCCQNLASREFLDAAWLWLMEKRRLVQVGENFGPSELQVRLNKAQQGLLAEVLLRIEQSGLTPPGDKELATAIGAQADTLAAIITYCEEEELLVRVAPGLHFTPKMVEKARRKCLVRLGKGDATVSELREAWGVNRKTAICLCEYFDTVGVTVRDGDVRRLCTQHPSFCPMA
ncbi:MAG: selenocysteine-specific translation elongation factor [Planctomycetota bacterium]|nr:selenocysteine-specific translation elongation factor [Planctomycetota bacterium]